MSVVRDDPASFVVRLSQALAVARLHDLSNVALEEPVRDLVAHLGAVIATHGYASLKPELESQMLFFNDRAVRMRKQASGMLESLVKLFGLLGVGELRFSKALTENAVRGLLAAVKENGTGTDPAEVCRRLVAALPRYGLVGSVDILSLEQAAAKAVDRKLVVEESLAVRLAYARTITLLREYMKNLRDEELRRYFARKLLRAVQGLQTLSERAPKMLLALTLVKDADDYAFNHPVNTCILTLLLGKKLGFAKGQLVPAGLSALLHGLGTFRTDPSIVGKAAEERSPAQRKDYGRHPYRGVGAILEARKLDDAAVVCAIVNFQYEACAEFPAVRKPLEELHPLARIVAVCEAYDALTSPRLNVPAVLPDVALGMLLAGQPRPFDFTVLGVFSNMIGMTPPGSAVELDDGTYAVVLHPNQDDPRRPVVVVVRDKSGADVDGDVIDLAAKDAAGGRARRIVGGVDPVALGLKIPEYLRA